jgi:hypothetical protein
MSWFEARAYAPFERANGIRLPPITGHAAREGGRSRRCRLAWELLVR